MSPWYARPMTPADTLEAIRNLDRRDLKKQPNLADIAIEKIRWLEEVGALSPNETIGAINRIKILSGRKKR